MHAHELVIAGYGFGDQPLNRAIGAFLGGDAHMVIVDPEPGIRLRAEATTGISREQIRHIRERLPDGFRNL